ncbi:hypothetical protein A9Q83_12330 [Alphaproteobacteria bacterium 46_93_T64]|nr:hypothetical protein A9Q83_12330 [Alphaproteobacteria bacterium 46_93_T64]
MEKPNVVSANLNSTPGDKVGIIAGRGELPLRLANTLKERGTAVFLLLVENEAKPEDYANFSFEIVQITKIGKFLKALKREKCKRVTMAGPIDRPNFKSIFPDKEGFKLLTKIGKSLSKGDDGLLGAITQFIEDKGFQVVGAHELDSEFVAKIGTLGKITPTEEDLKDIEKGAEIIRAMSVYDIGQAVIVRAGYVLGVEAAEGTEKLIHRCKEFSWDNPAGVLVKLSKTGQDLRTDMPAIGVDTIRQIKTAGLSGIAVEAEHSLILGLDEVVSVADKSGVFVHVISTDCHSDD